MKFKRHSDSDLSELASALATLELGGGRSLKAKKLFAQALIAPNENVLAQVEWASKALNIDLEPRSRQVPLAYEANAWGSYRKQNYLGAMEHSMNWLHDEPFSGRAANFGSFVAAIQEDFAKSQKFIELGMKANPDDVSLQNNQIFM